MGTVEKFVSSLLVAFFGTLAIAGTILRVTVALYMHPPDYSPPWYQVLVPITVFGSLVLAPTLFALCYRYLDKRHKQD